MNAHGLLDSGALLAVLDRGDRWHSRCVECLREMRLPLATTSAVLTEVFHLLPAHQADAVWGVLQSGGVTVLPIGDGDLPDVRALMDRYRDRPMDFADATLVHLARRENLQTILSVDDDFLVYRIEGRRQFLVYPPR